MGGQGASADGWLVVVFFGIVGAIAIAQIVIKSNRIKELKGWNFEWYQEQYPANVVDNKVTCRKCGSGNIGTERMMDKSYMRAHICRTCGTKLYFSPE